MIKFNLEIFDECYKQIINKTDEELLKEEYNPFYMKMFEVFDEMQEIINKEVKTMNSITCTLKDPVFLATQVTEENIPDILDYLDNLNVDFEYNKEEKSIQYKLSNGNTKIINFEDFIITSTMDSSRIIKHFFINYDKIFSFSEKNFDKLFIKTGN
jgi:hypothetical protein